MQQTPNGPWQQQPFPQQPNTSYPPQQPLPSPQFNQQQYPPQYQHQPPMMPPPAPKKKPNAALGCGIIMVIVSVCSLASWFTISSAATKPTALAPTATTQAFLAATATSDLATPTDAPTATPTPKPKPTQGKTPVNSVTHGTPHLGGPISDFYGKYGTQIMGDVQSGSAPNGSPESSVGWVTDSNNAYFLSVHYYTPSNIMNYITYSGPTDWSKAQYRDFLLTFAPPGAAENVSTNNWWKGQGGDPYNPIAYTSNIGNFFFHISDGSGYMNTV